MSGICLGRRVEFRGPVAFHSCNHVRHGAACIKVARPKVAPAPVFNPVI
jgi:hypothetical protein